MRTISARFVPPVLGLALALAAAVAPATAQETRTASPGAVISAPASAAPAAPDQAVIGTFRPLPIGLAALTDREQLLLSLFATDCGGEIAFDSLPDNECPDRLTEGQGVGCTLREAQLGLLDALKGNCMETCGLIRCGERKKDQCGSFGYHYKSNPDDCEEITAPDCPNQMGFACDAPSVRCICICVNA